MVQRKLRKGILASQYPSSSEAKRLDLDRNVKLDSKTIRKLRASKLTMKEFKRRFGIK